MRGGVLVTFDIGDSRSAQAKAVWDDQYMIRKYEDLLEAEGVCRPFNCTPTNEVVIKHVSDADIWLIDNGIKDKETFLYAKYAPIGSCAIVHDMSMDITQFDLFNQPFSYWGYESIYLDFAMSVGSHLRAWKRTSHAGRGKHREPQQSFGSTGGYA